MSHYYRGIHPPTEKTHSKQEVFFCLHKFTTSGNPNKDKKVKRQNVITQKDDKVDKEFKCVLHIYYILDNL